MMLRHEVSVLGRQVMRPKPTALRAHRLVTPGTLPSWHVAAAVTRLYGLHRYLRGRAVRVVVRRSAGFCPEDASVPPGRAPCIRKVQ
jgi:hypothetical protein